jgi:sigma-B regulation protein RsbU (phosphoserine phosphatase)
MAKFIGETQSQAAIREYLGNRRIDSSMGVSEFELPKLKRFTEKTLAGSVGAAAAGAIVESYLSDVGSKMEPVYDIFSTVRASLDESRENLYVRLRASEIMNRTLDLQIIMDDLLDLLLKEFKLDLAVVWLETDNGTLMPRATKGMAGHIKKSENMPTGTDSYLRETFRNNHVTFVNDTQNLPIGSGNSLNIGGIRSYAHIPISREGEPAMGILSVYSKTIAGLFTEQFLKLLASLTGQLAQAVKIVSEMDAKERERQEKEEAQVENARVLRDMELAKQIQLSLLPAKPPQINGAEFASLCIQAAHVGGDYYDFFYQSDDSVDMVIADVSGHSVGAALIMVEARSVLRAQIPSATTASDILASLNELLYDDLTSAELFISMFYAKYDAITRRLTYANAGHNPPILFHHLAPSCTELDAEGMILGVKKEVAFEEKTVDLKPKDILVFYTDGITEAQSPTGELFGVDRLCSVISENRIASSQEIIKAITEAIEHFSQREALRDDISLIVMKIA